MLLYNEDFLLKIFALYELKTYFCITNTVGIAQLVRALDCGSRGRRFEPDYLPASKGFSVMRGFFYALTYSLLSGNLRSGLLNLLIDYKNIFNSNMGFWENWQRERISDQD